MTYFFFFFLGFHHIYIIICFMLHKNNFTCVTLKRRCKKKIEKNQIQHTHTDTFHMKHISSYCVRFLNITDFNACCRIESGKYPPSGGRKPFVINKNLQSHKQTNKCFNAVQAGVKRCKSHLGTKLLPCCVWYLTLSPAEEEDESGPPPQARLLCFHSGPFLHSSTIQDLQLRLLSAHRLAFFFFFYRNVEFLPPHITVEENSTPPLSTFNLLIPHFLFKNRPVHQGLINHVHDCMSCCGNKKKQTVFDIDGGI